MRILLIGAAILLFIISFCLYFCPRANSMGIFMDMDMTEGSSGGIVPPTGGSILLETGDRILSESGDSLLLE